MKKFFAIALAGLLSLTMLAGCGDGDNKTDNNTDNNNTATNHAPVISGVQPEVTIMAGTEYDALAGVTATDEEDGDLTNKIVVSCDELTVTNGKVTPTAVNTTMGYFISYTVKDSGGLEATASTTLFVTEKVSEPETVYTADFTAPTAKDEDKHGWNAWIDTGKGIGATAEVKDGAYVIDVTNMPQTLNDDGAVNLNRTINDLGVGQYQFIVWAKASVETYYCLFAKDAVKSEWTTYGDGHYHQKLDTATKAYKLDFELTEENLTEGKTNIEFHFNLGRKNSETETSAKMPEKFTVYVEKIALWKTTGVETRTSLKTADYTKTVDGLYKNDHTTITQGTEGADVAITYSDEDNKDWYAQVTIGLPDITVTKGEKYYYSIKVKGATAAIDSFIVCVEDSMTGWEKRNSYDTFQVPENDETVIEKVIVAGDGQDTAADLTDAVCRLYLGIHTAGTASNKLTIESFEFGKIEGNKETSRVSLDKFVLFGEDSSNKTNVKYPYAVYNGSDDDLGKKGIGTAYIKDGKLVYEIHEGSNVAGQNKLVIGYGDNPVILPGNAIYVITLKIKASTAIKFDLCLHDMDCGSNWDDGLIFRRASYENGQLDAGTDEDTITLETPIYYKETNGKCELILEFGSAELAKLEGGVTIEISEIKIEAKKLVD